MLIDLSNFQPILSKKDEQLYILDSTRGKYFVLTPEEWVRQAFIDYLTKEGYPANLMQIERNIAYPHRKKRPDIICYNRTGYPFLLVECKAQSIQLNEETLTQALAYNWVVRAPYILITNGLEAIMYDTQTQMMLDSLPAYPLSDMG